MNSRCSTKEAEASIASYGPAIFTSPDSVRASRTGVTLTISINTAADRFLVGLNRARRLAKRAISMTRLKAIGTSIVIYANERNDTPPPTLAKLVEAKLIQAKMLLSPSSGRTTI